MKKGQGLSLHTIVVAILALAVLVILIFIFTGKISGVSDGLTKCPGTCTNSPNCNVGDKTVYAYESKWCNSEQNTGVKGKYCCAGGSESKTTENNNENDNSQD